MEYVTIAGTDIRMSRVALGTWAIGGALWGGSDETESIRTIHAALAQGVNTIDTAPAYGLGRSEEIVGKAVKEYGRREELVLSTKAGLEWDEAGRVVRNSSRESILQGIEDSLLRLQTDYIDVYCVHWPDPLVHFEETAETMSMLLSQGKIRAVGVSNYSPGEMDLFLKGSPIQAAQPPYNLFERAVEADILPYCTKYGFTTMTYGALCRGLLSGNMTPETRFNGDDLRRMDPKFQQPRYKQYLEAVSQLDRFARERHGKTVLHLAVRWILDKGPSAALWGARHPEQMDALPEILGWTLSVEDFQHVELILEECITRPVGPEFLAPPTRGRETEREELWNMFRE
jgi:aryl-alcohol dehydrogenase-like predicted oxidoreductase